MMSYLKFLVYSCVVACVLLGACATPFAPQGGVKDTRKPRIVFSSPADQSLNVKTSKVMVVFNEPIRTKNLKSNLVIIPNTGNEYEFKEKNNTVILKFKQELRPNTTFVFNFDEAIEDITEKNTPSNARIAFSTGKEIDTLYIYGTVRGIDNDAPEKEFTVGLYDATDTFNIEKHKPLYFAKTDTVGRYRIDNIRAGKYFLYALGESKKKNMIYDSYDERIAFKDTIVITTQTEQLHPLYTLTYDYRPIKITSKRTRRQYFEIKTSKNIVNADVQFVDSSWVGKILYQKDKDILRFYNGTTAEKIDSLAAYISLQDSAGLEVKDTVQIKFQAVDEKERTKTKGTLEGRPKTGTKLNKGMKIRPTFVFSVPIDHFHADSIRYINHKDTLLTRADQWVFNAAKTELYFKDSVTIDNIVVFKAPKATFIGLEKDTLPASEVSYSPKKEEEYASLSGVVRINTPYFVLQVLNEKNEVEAEARNTKEFNFKYIEAGNKKFRIVIDNNRNGKWDKGDFRKGIAPEKTLYFNDEALKKVAPNWVYEDIIIEVKEE